MRCSDCSLKRNCSVRFGVRLFRDFKKQFNIQKKKFSGNFVEQEGMVAALEGVLVGEGPGAKREEARLVEPSVS